MNATVTGIDVIEIVEIVSIATDILILTVAIVHALAHLNMIRMLLSVVVLNKTGRRATGTPIVQVCLRPLVGTVEKTTALNGLAAVLLVIIMVVSGVSAKSNASDRT